MCSTDRPIYRDDIKGNLSGVKADCVATFRGEIEHSDSFVFSFEDCTHTVAEYAVYLTPAELRACYAKATKGAEVSRMQSSKRE